MVWIMGAGTLLGFALLSSVGLSHQPQSAPVADYYVEYLYSIGDEVPGGIPRPWAMASHGGELYVSDLTTAENGRILKVSGRKGEVLAVCPRPVALAVDSSGSIVVGGGHSLFRVSNGTCELYLSLHISVNSIVFGRNGDLFVANRMDPAQQNILQFDSHTGFVRSFGGWLAGEGQHSQAFLALNLQQLRFINGELYAVGITTSAIRRFASGVLVADRPIDISPYNPFAHEAVKATANGGVEWKDKLHDIAPIDDHRFFALIAAQHDNRPRRVLGLIVSPDMTVLGEARLSPDTDPARVSPTFQQLARLSENTFAFLDRSFKRIDVLRISPR